MARLLVAFVLLLVAAEAKIALTPPMGWMSWEIFRCETDCDLYPNSCINDKLYMSTVDAMVSDGYLAAGYDTIHIDDCWERKDPPRDPSTNRLVPEPTRFPNGMKALADYTHDKGMKFGIYTAESPTTCGGYPASADHEAIDAETFAEWGVDYLKVDGCGDKDYYPKGYPAMGAALTNQSRDIVYSCSWPAYLGSNETVKPFDTMIDAHCNLWRNWADIQCHWSSLMSIIDHWGDYGEYIKQFAAPGHWNDPDMLLIGNDCITDDEARTQMAMWSIFAAPLIMGNDARNITPSGRDILLNEMAIEINQDPKGEQGLRISPKGATEVWARNLSNGDVAIGLYNKQGGIPALNQSCPHWNASAGGYFTACGGAGGNDKCVSGVPLDQLMSACCEDPTCVGISWNENNGGSCLKNNDGCGWTTNADYMYFGKMDPTPPQKPTTIEVAFADVGVSGSVEVIDIWAKKSLGTFTDRFSANVPSHGTGFYRLKVQ